MRHGLVCCGNFLQVSREHIGKRFWKVFCTAHFAIIQFQRYWILESVSQTNKISCVNSCLKKRSACVRSSSCRSEILSAWTVRACTCNGADLIPLTRSLLTNTLSHTRVHTNSAGKCTRRKSAFPDEKSPIARSCPQQDTGCHVCSALKWLCVFKDVISYLLHVLIRFREHKDTLHADPLPLTLFYFRYFSLSQFCFSCLQEAAALQEEVRLAHCQIAALEEELYRYAVTEVRIF
jgi:hypothetical protein